MTILADQTLHYLEIAALAIAVLCGLAYLLGRR